MAKATTARPAKDECYRVVLDLCCSAVDIEALMGRARAVGYGPVLPQFTGATRITLTTDQEVVVAQRGALIRLTGRRRRARGGCDVKRK